MSTSAFKKGQVVEDEMGNAFTVLAILTSDDGTPRLNLRSVVTKVVYSDVRPDWVSLVPGAIEKG